jgi:hypothetical protein
VAQTVDGTIFTDTEGINVRAEDTMRSAVSVLAVLLVAASALATEPVVRYYVGEAKLSSADGKSLGSEVFLAKRTVDRDKSTITEQPIIVDEKGKVMEATITFSIKEDGSFTVTDDAKRMKGTGKLFGPAWKWTYFKATYKVGDVVEIEDENFFSNESFGTARQKLKWKDKDATYKDLALKEITPKTYEILRAGLMKK